MPTLDEYLEIAFDALENLHIALNNKENKKTVSNAIDELEEIELSRE